MSVNKRKPHVLVPEDDANSDLANGFLRDNSLLTQNVRVLRPARGWSRVLDSFLTDHVAEMERYSDRSMVLLIDFDGDSGRLSHVKAQIPVHLSHRVYILGALKEPIDLTKAGLGSYETIGSELARECREETYKTWSHDLLRHNAGELDRLRERVRPILFAS
jgi:hypothetical protein